MYISFSEINNKVYSQP